MIGDVMMRPNGPILYHVKYYIIFYLLSKEVFIAKRKGEPQFLFYI